MNNSTTQQVTKSQPQMATTQQVTKSQNPPVNTSNNEKIKGIYIDFLNKYSKDTEDKSIDSEAVSLVKKGIDKIFSGADEDAKKQLEKLSGKIIELQSIDESIYKLIDENEMGLNTETKGNYSEVLKLKNNLLSFQEAIVKYFVLILSGDYKKGSASEFRKMVPILSSQFTTMKNFVVENMNSVPTSPLSSPTSFQEGGNNYKEQYNLYRYKEAKYTYGLLRNLEELKKYS
jgi:predicted DNA-binding protein